MSDLLERGTTYFRQAASTRSGLLIDGQSYYRAFARCAQHAKRSIFLCGWQFDSTVRLLRGKDAQGNMPTELLPFLEALCARNPQLEVYILAWDYSIVFVPERELLQKWIFNGSSSSRIHFEFDSTARAGASHHLKFAVIDGETAFAGGMDICSERWDDQQHRRDNPDRVDTRGEPYKPFHDVQALLCGEAARVLHHLFIERWQQAVGPLLDIEPVGAPTCSITPDVWLPSTPVALSMTRRDATVTQTEILELFSRAICSASQFIYVETQYFTSAALHNALLECTVHPRKEPLQVIFILPESPSPKEDLVLGDAQIRQLSDISRSFRQSGHEFRAYSTGPDAETCTYVHSKVVIVDDGFLSVGSANFTNRSMSVDTELQASWEFSPDDANARYIRDVRTRLLCEHTGIDDPAVFADPRTLVSRLDALANDPASKLRPHTALRSAERSRPKPGLSALIFDPPKPLDELALDDLIFASTKDWFSFGM